MMQKILSEHVNLQLVCFKLSPSSCETAGKALGVVQHRTAATEELQQKALSFGGAK